MGKIERIRLAPGDGERLERLVRDRNTPQKVVWRARIVLLAGNGIGAVEAARRVGKSVPTVRRRPSALCRGGGRRTSEGRHAPART
jgi:transposase